MTVRTVLRGLPRALLRGTGDALLPQRCVACGRFGAALHRGCLGALPAAEPPRCGLCWAPGPSLEGWCARCALAPPAFAALRTPFRYEGVARRALLEAKFGGVTALLPPLGEAAASVVPSTWRIEAVVAVPLHPSRRRRRGFDQAQLLGRAVAQALAVPARNDLVRRAWATAPQARLGAVDRARNVEHAFVVLGEPPSSLLLVDDVTTTGSTLGAVASTLRAAGAERVYALAVARED